MSITQEGSDAPEVPLGRLRGVFASAVVAALVALGDALFFLHPPGISLTIFFLALIGAVAVVAPTTTLLRSRTLALGTLAMISALPFAESDDVLWIPMALGAVGLFALAAAGALPRYEDWPGAAMRFGFLAPFRLASDLLHGDNSGLTAERLLAKTLEHHGLQYAWVGRPQPANSRLVSAISENARMRRIAAPCG